MIAGAVDCEGRIADRKKAVSALSDYVILYEEPELLFDMCVYASGVEMKEVLGKLYELLNSDGKFSYGKRRKLIEKELLKCINENETLNFIGFLRFRLYEYENLLLSAVLSAAVMK